MGDEFNVEGFLSLKKVDKISYKIEQLSLVDYNKGGRLVLISRRKWLTMWQT